MKLLLIEPDKMLARTYMAYLRQQGMQVRHAADAQGAVQFIDQEEPDLVILELQMARHNGIEFLYELRSYSDLQHIPVIAHTLLTPGHMNQSSELLTALGVTYYLYKPATSLQRLGRTVREILQPATV
jgi:DNA-binding response OmpR family regulator